MPVLLRRLLAQAGVHDIQVNPPIRRRRWEFLNQDSLRKSVRLALIQPDCAGILILFDADEDCPKLRAPELQRWAQAEARAIPCAVVMAKCEYEAWFLAALESLRGKRGIRKDAVFQSDPEEPRDAKGTLEEQMETNFGYSPTVDQAPLTKGFDFQTAFARSRSFHRMANAFGAIVAGMGIVLNAWPPAEWQAAG